MTRAKFVKAQASMILIILVILIFVGLTVFLLSFAVTISPIKYTNEHMNIYAHNLWLSISRSDTGYSGADCKLVSDVIACSFLKPEWYCGDLSCFELGNHTVSNYLQSFEESRRGDYYLKIEAFQLDEFGERKPVIVRLPSGQILKYEFGNSSLENPELQRWVANEVIPKGQYLLKVRLILTKD